MRTFKYSSVKKRKPHVDAGFEYAHGRPKNEEFLKYYTTYRSGLIEKRHGPT